MALKLLHQVGHNSNWNIASFEQDHCGDGLILSPLHQRKEAVEQLSAATRAKSIFDPQFYLPSSRKPKLLSYPFFPESVGSGFETSSFKSHALPVAEACVKFQVEQGFRTVVVPTRFIDQMVSAYIDKQRQFTVEAFMEAAGDRPLCLSLAVTSAMIEDQPFRNKLLNWVTSYPNVEEVYLMYQHPRGTKQIQEVEFLKACREFFREISDTGLRLIVGYTNTEGVLFSSIKNISLTMGAFENTRIFSTDRFLISEEERRGPKARIYLSGLLNWVQFEDAKTIRARAPDVWSKVYEATPYSEQALGLAAEPTFNQPQLYKHYFVNMHDLFAQMKPLSLGDRNKFVVDRLQKAKAAYSALDKAGVQLEKHGRGGHIDVWIAAM